MSKAVRTSATAITKHKKFVVSQQSAQTQCNGIQVFFTTVASFLQAVKSFIAALYCKGPHKCNTTAIQEKFLYCSCIVVVLHLCGPLKSLTTAALVSTKACICRAEPSALCFSKRYSALYKSTFYLLTYLLCTMC